MRLSFSYPWIFAAWSIPPRSIGGKSSGAVTGLECISANLKPYLASTVKVDALNDLADMTGGKAFTIRTILTAVSAAPPTTARPSTCSATISTHTTTSPVGANSRSRWARRTLKSVRDGFFVTNATMNPLLSRGPRHEQCPAFSDRGNGRAPTVQWLSLAADGDKKKAPFAAHMPAGGLSSILPDATSSTSISPLWPTIKTEKPRPS